MVAIVLIVDVIGLLYYCCVQTRAGQTVAWAGPRWQVGTTDLL